MLTLEIISGKHYKFQRNNLNSDKQSTKLTKPAKSSRHLKFLTHVLTEVTVVKFKKISTAIKKFKLLTF